MVKKHTNTGKENLYKKASLIALALIFTTLILAQNINASDNWWNESFNYRKNINITNTGTTNLTNFPIYLNISKEINMQTNYNDLRFILGNCKTPHSTTLDYELEYNNTNFTLSWVKIPNFKTGINQICMYYGNSTILSGATNSAVWNNNYGIVYHMDGAGQDSTSNNRNKVSNIGAPTQNNTFLGYGVTYDGNDAWNLQNLAYWEAEWTDRVHEIIFETSTDINTRQTLFAEGGGINGILMYILNGQLYARWWSESTPTWGGNHFNTSITANTKYYATMYLSEFGNYSLYLNGKLITTLNAPDHIDAHSGDGGIAYTGATNKDYHDISSANNFFIGNIYELRTQDTHTQDNWYMQTYQNTLNHTSNTLYNTQEKYYPEIEITINSPSTAAIYSILQNQTLTYNATITCNGKTSSTCQNITIQIKYNNTPTTFTNISTTSTIIPMWTSSSNPQNCILTGGTSCTQFWTINLTGLPNTRHSINLQTSSNLSLIPNITSQNLTVDIVKGNIVSFNQTVYTYPIFTKWSGSKIKTLKIKSDIGDNTNITIKCESGDCNIIKNNWINGINLLETNTKKFNFTCIDNTTGAFSAIFNVSSNESTKKSTITINCDIKPVYGPIQIIMNKPTPLTTTLIGQNQTFILNGTMNCIGECGNITAYAIYQQPFGTGKDGNITISTPNTIINKYNHLTGNENSGDNTITINNTINFSKGDEILIIQIQDGAGTGTAGNYEFNYIEKISGNNLTLKIPLRNTYGSGTYNAISSTVTQIVKIPQYTTVTINPGSSITAPAWNGYYGGIVAMRVTNQITTNGYINVSNKGFRGGDCNGCGDSAWGDQGECTTGIGTNSLSANICGGGGGYGPSGLGGEPGGGGGYGTSGGTGLGQYLTDASGGTTIGTPDLSKLYFGGGAGGGGDNDNLAPLPQYIDGAGIAMIFAQNIKNAKIHAKGEKGIISQNNGGTTGAGAGGTIWISSYKLNITDVNASGGTQVLGYGNDFGGAGGEGRIRFDYYTKTGKTTPIEGYKGTLLDIINTISTTSGNIPLWTSSSNPKTCNPTEDGDCPFQWIINATGAINSSHNIGIFIMSNLTNIADNISKLTTINISDNIIPTITLLSPINNSKILTNGTIQLIWTISDDSSTLNCSLFINDILNQTNTCSNSGNNTINITLNRGKYNWIIQVTDITSNTINSTTNHFTIIKNQATKITKKIYQINTNQYIVQTNITNLLNNTIQTPKPIDFVDTTFSYGSFNIIYNWTNSTTGKHTGNIMGWINFQLNKSETRQINYSLSGVGDYNLRKNYIIGIE